MSFRVPNKYRIKTGLLASEDSIGNNGAFLIAHSPKNLLVIASDGQGWEHVSVSLPNRTPKWEEMCFVKALFWQPEDCVIQYHPPKSEYVDCHKFCLHLWRPIDSIIPCPPGWMVGPK